MDLGAPRGRLLLGARGHQGRGDLEGSARPRWPECNHCTRRLGSGRYLLSGLSSKTSYVTEAWLIGYVVEHASGMNAFLVKPGVQCDFRATPIRRLSISVALPDGKQPERAVISWAPAAKGTGGSAAWSPAEPEISVPPGTYAFTAWAGGPGDTLYVHDFVPGSRDGPDAQEGTLYRSLPKSATVDDAAWRPLELRLDSRPGVLVRLAFEGARRARSVRVAAVALEGTSAGDPSLLFTAKGVRELWLDGIAEAAIAGLDPGTYLIGATFRGGKVGATTTAVVGSGLTPVDLRIPDIDPMDAIRVRVLDPEGQPMHEVQLECGCRGSEGSDTVKVGTLPGADGTFQVEHFAKGASIFGGGYASYWRDIGEGPLAYFVQATSARYGIATTTYDPAKDREVTVRFAAPALLRVLIPGFAANPRRDRAVLEMEWAGEEDEKEQHPDLKAPIDVSGVARFPPAVPGSYAVVLRLAAGSDPKDLETAGWTGTKVAMVPVTLPSGETTVTVAFPVYSDLTVTYDGDTPRLQRMGADGVTDTEEAGTVENGAVVFRNVPEGRFRLYDTRRGAMWVDLPMPGPIAFQPIPFNALRFEVTGEGHARDLGLKTGDLIVRIEGLEFGDPGSMQKAIGAAMVKGTAKLTIKREGTTFDLTAEIRKLMEDKGSDVEPWVQ